MIDNWQESGALMGAVAIITGGMVKIFSGNSKRGGEVLDSLIANQAAQTRILDRLSLLIEHRDTRTEELHRDTHRKLDEVTENQRDIINVVERGLNSLRGL